jgi:hypothetical protein
VTVPRTEQERRAQLDAMYAEMTEAGLAREVADLEAEPASEYTARDLASARAALAKRREETR